MKWIGGETGDHRRKRKAEWHGWFAWHPVRVGVVHIETDHGVPDERHAWAWLERVARKGALDWNGWNWKYQAFKERAL